MSNLGLLTRSLFSRRMLHPRLVALPSYNICHKKLSSSTGFDTIGQPFFLNSEVRNFGNTAFRNHHLVNTVQKRYKKRRGQRKNQDEESDDENDEDAGENPLLADGSIAGLPRDYEEKVIEVVSMRLDAIAHVAFGKTRQRIEEAVYKKELLVNRELPTKKAMELQEGDDICMIVKREEDGTALAMRVLIDSVHDLMTSKGRSRVTIHRWQRYTMPPELVEQ